MVNQNHSAGQEMELLAPAGSFEAFRAGVENGADAIYLGGKSFSARASAANFDAEELRRAVQYAHERNVKVYVTVNILIADQEFPELFEYLFSLYETGVDAVLLQDIGVADLIQSILPEIERHASTQITVNTSWGVHHLEGLGFQRVVLARETSAEEMKMISRKTPLDIEVFVHGALCVCYSGQCLMSSFIGGRSGNRGRCAQPCRMAYHLVNEERSDTLKDVNLGEHLLSPRDMNLVDEITLLKESGVYSLKVEGRMKRPEYVATVIRVYRQALDYALAENSRQSEVKPIGEEERRELLQIFNRDFTQAYLKKHPGAELMSYMRPNNRGIRLGRVAQTQDDRIELKLEAALRPGDGIDFWTSRGHEGITVETIWRGQEEVAEGRSGEHVQIIFPGSKTRAGDRVFKTYDEQLMTKARLSFQEGKEQRKRALKARLSGSVGEFLTLEMWEGERSSKVQSTSLAQQALKRPLTQDYAFQQLNRLGTTPFYLEELVLDLQGEVMLPVSDLNEMRRLAVEGLLQEGVPRKQIRRAVYDQRIQDWKRKLAEEHEQLVQAEAPDGRASQDSSRNNRNSGATHHRQKHDTQSLAAERLTVSVSDLESARAALQAGARRIAMGGERWRSRKGMTPEEVREGVELCQKYEAQALWRLPRILNEGQSVRLQEILDKAKNWEKRPRILLANLGELELLKEIDPEWEFETDFSLNVFNQASLAYWLRQGAQTVTLSPEMEHHQLEQISSWPKTEIMAFGDLEMMVSEYCPVGATLGGKKGKYCSAPCVREPHYLRDRLKYDFPIETDLDCRMHLFNARSLNLYKELGEIAKMGIGNIRLQLNRATPEQIRDTVRVFLEGWEKALHGEQITEQELEHVSAYLAERFPEGFTKGHYFRGIL
ncbi:DUF3656 domain-containing U32 family peptidase [Desulfitobacterium sp.]|uniref:DUF3656 domain-containing U32 family peptidase n=1 Tax=Desulfitobacterium sp. TaxID=49981 RepID=UPI002C17507D|nr:DUF3656 domain-containing protein [Desulfitobacterium sp.]HVJ48320.1 DUF3656 domain-containing protein [Desulfitobacterium sp.]